MLLKTPCLCAGRRGLTADAAAAGDMGQQHAPAAAAAEDSAGGAGGGMDWEAAAGAQESPQQSPQRQESPDQQAPAQQREPRPRRQWHEQGDDAIPAYNASCGCYVGHFAENACFTPPRKSDLNFLQPGHDGSGLDPLCGGQAFTPDELAGPKGKILRGLADWVTEQLAIKLQHSSPVAAYKDQATTKIHDPFSDQDFRKALHSHAPTYHKALRFLQRMGAEVRYAVLRCHPES